MQRDNKVFDIIDREHLRQRRGIELIASENFVSDEVMRAMGSCLTNKYAEGYPGHRYYGGCQIVDEAEQLAIDRAKKLFGAEWANVQPHSGAQANMAVFMACLKPGDTFMGMDLSHGGHLSHGSPVNFSGLHFNAISYTVDPETGRVNYDEMEEKARAERPKLIIAGASAYSREWDYARIRKLADGDRRHFHGGYGPSCRPHRRRSSGESREACPHRYDHYTQDTSRSSWRSDPDGQGFRQSLGQEKSQGRESARCRLFSTPQCSPAFRAALWSM